MPEASGRLTILGDRGGTIAEITQFLTDLEGAYLALYAFDHPWFPRYTKRYLPPELWMELAFPFPGFGRPLYVPTNPDLLPPSVRLTLERVRIESPGFWEFLASLNPLQQIREYLNDRHRRRQDKDFREASEKERLQLENELIRRQIVEKDNGILRDRIAVLREAGYSDEDIQRLIWATVGTPLVRLGRHQDTRLISSAESSSAQQREPQ